MFHTAVRFRSLNSYAQQPHRKYHIRSRPYTVRTVRFPSPFCPYSSHLSFTHAKVSIGGREFGFLCSYLNSYLTSLGVWGAAGLGLLVGGLIGLINGLLVTRVGINPLITTLGMLSMVRGLAFVFSGGLSIAMLDKDFAQLGRGTVLGLPTLVAVVIHYVSCGGDPDALYRVWAGCPSNAIN